MAKPNITIHAFVEWPEDDRVFAIIGTMSDEAMAFLIEQLNDKDRELVNVTGISIDELLVGNCADEFLADIEQKFEDLPENPVIPEKKAPMSKEDILDYHMPFGKYGKKNYPPKGKTLYEIARENPKYLDWAVDGLSPSNVRDKIREAVMHPTIAKLIDGAVHG